MRPESRVRPSRSGNQHVLPRVIGAVAGIALAAWSAYWLFAGQDHGKLLTILVGTACIAGCWLAAVASLGSKRGTAVASAAAVIVGAVSAIVALLVTPPGTTGTPPATPPSVTVPTVTTTSAAANPPPATAQPPQTKPADTPRSKVPARLVGTWSGGTDGATANWVYKFSANGDVEHTNGRIGVQERGTVVIKGDQMTLYFPPKQPEQVRWSVSDIDAGFGYKFSNLQLSGLSYVRQDAEPSN